MKSKVNIVGVSCYKVRTICASVWSVAHRVRVKSPSCHCYLWVTTVRPQIKGSYCDDSFKSGNLKPFVWCIMFLRQTHTHTLGLLSRGRPLWHIQTLALCNLSGLRLRQNYLNYRLTHSSILSLLSFSHDLPLFIQQHKSLSQALSFTGRLWS